MKKLKVFSHEGPGGRNCPCCGPSPKFRKKHDRMVKRRIKQYEGKELKKLLREVDSD